MLCDGDRSHSGRGLPPLLLGTSILQAQLAGGSASSSTHDRRTGTRTPYEQACSPLVRLPDAFERARERAPLRAAAEPLPRGEATRSSAARTIRTSQISSLMRRACAESPRLVRCTRSQRCYILEKRRRGGGGRARATGPWTSADFAVDSRTILQQVVPGHLASPDAPSLFIEQSAVRAVLRGPRRDAAVAGATARSGDASGTGRARGRRVGANFLQRRARRLRARPRDAALSPRRTRRCALPSRACPGRRAFPADQRFPARGGRAAGNRRCCVLFNAGWGKPGVGVAVGYSSE